MEKGEWAGKISCKEKETLKATVLNKLCLNAMFRLKLFDNGSLWPTDGRRGGRRRLPFEGFGEYDSLREIRRSRIS